MIKLETIEFAQNLISFLIVYFPTVSLAGYFESWIAKKMGDSTAQDAGYLTLNPLIHMDPIGLAILVIPPHFGFGSRIPLNPSNISKKFEKIKLFLMFFARTIAHLFLTIFALFLFILIQSKLIGNFDILTSNVSPLLVSIILVVTALFNLNILSFVVYFIIGLLRIFIYFLLPDLEYRSSLVNFMVFLFPFLFILVLGPYVEYVLRLFLFKINFLFGFLLK